VNVRHFVPLEGKFLLITLVIVRITLNVRQMPLKFPLNNGVSIVQKLVPDVVLVIVYLLIEEFEDTKGVIRIRKSKKDRQHNG
jgi:hypothetical protein